MSLFIISQQGDQQLNSPVFHAGGDGSDEAVAVFTSRDLAHEYVKAAGWEQDEEIAELRESELLHWLMTAADGGTKVVAVDPRREQQDDVPQPTMSIPELLTDAGQVLVERLRLPTPELPAKGKRMDMLHCQRCGKVSQQKSGDEPPECCGEKMVVAATDVVERPVTH
jgi:hypothetical protein